MKVAINGLGRIGRQVLRRIQGTPGLELVAVNDLGELAGLAHLVQYDSLHGRAGFPVGHEDGCLLLDQTPVPCFREPDPLRLPFAQLGAQLVLECTGACTDRAWAARHLQAGVPRVLIGGSVPDADLTVVPGVNEHRLGPQPPAVLAAGCATTQALALLLRVLDLAFGVRAALATAVESYGNDQRILDLPHPDLRMARAAAASMIPAPSGAAASLDRILPHLAGRVDVQAIRVPTPDVGLVDLSVTLERDATPAALLAAFRAAAQAPPLAGLLEVLEAPLVSSDLRGGTASCVLDALLTKVMTPRFVKVFGWFDNEVAYAARLVDLCLRLKGIPS